MSHALALVDATEPLLKRTQVDPLVTDSLTDEGALHAILAFHRATPKSSTSPPLPLLRRLLASGASPFAADGEGSSPVHIAAASLHAGALEALLSRSTPGWAGDAASFDAACARVVSSCGPAERPAPRRDPNWGALSTPPPEPPPPPRATPLVHALLAVSASIVPGAEAEPRSVRSVRALLSCPGGAASLAIASAAEPPQLPLHVASLGVGTSMPRAVCDLLAAALRSLHDSGGGIGSSSGGSGGAGIDGGDSDSSSSGGSGGRSLVFAAASGCALHALAAASDGGGALDAALEAVRSGADATASDEVAHVALRSACGQVALHCAACGHATAALLRAYPGGVNAPDAAGRSALWLRCEADDAQSARLLLDAGASAGGEARDAAGKLPVDVAGPACREILAAEEAAAAEKRTARHAALRSKREARAAAAAADVQEDTDDAGADSRAAAAVGELSRLLCELEAASASDAAASAHEAARGLPTAPAHPPELACLAGWRWELLISRVAISQLFGFSMPLRVAALRSLTTLCDGDFSELNKVELPSSDTTTLSNRSAPKLFTVFVGDGAHAPLLLCEVARCFSPLLVYGPNSATAYTQARCILH